MELPGAELLEEMPYRGMAIYDSKLKEHLAPAHDNEFITTHLDSEDDTFGPSTAGAAGAMRRIHPQGQLLLVKIGPEPEHGLATRLQAGAVLRGPGQRRDDRQRVSVSLGWNCLRF